MNTSKINILACSILLFAAASLAHAQEIPVLSYDADRQALAINPYADGYGDIIHFDFDADHTWGGVIDQSVWSPLYGDVTSPGIFFSSVDCGAAGSCQTQIVYGWGARLGSVAAVQDYHSYVTQLPDGMETPNKLHFFAAVWDVFAGATTIYVQPMDASGNILPVLPEDLSHAYVQVNDGTGQTWRSLADLAPSAPHSEEVRVRLTPRHLNMARNGRWITAHIKLPKGRTSADVDFATIRLSFKSDSKDEEGFLLKSVLCSAPVKVVHRRNTCTVRFSREELKDRLVPGFIELVVSGKFKDGAAFSGQDVILVYAGSDDEPKKKRSHDGEDDDEDADEDGERD